LLCQKLLGFSRKDKTRKDDTASEDSDEIIEKEEATRRKRNLSGP
jgi:hypothetical protein